MKFQTTNLELRVGATRVHITNIGAWLLTVRFFDGKAWGRVLEVDVKERLDRHHAAVDILNLASGRTSTREEIDRPVPTDEVARLMDLLLTFARAFPGLS